MKAVVTVMGVDRTGIIAEVSNCLYKNDINILDINQTIMQDIFTMVMLVDLKESDVSMISEKLNEIGKKMGVEIRIQHEEIFRSMHRI